MIKMVISGGQTGADRAGLDTALLLGIKTGGTMPKGFLAHDGWHPEFKDKFGMKEHSTVLYQPRTAINVRESDGTIRLATDYGSAGEVLTLKMIKQYNKPHFDVDFYNTMPCEAAEWCIANNIQILNVAGNSARTSPIIYDISCQFLSEMFSIVNDL